MHAQERLTLDSWPVQAAGGLRVGGHAALAMDQVAISGPAGFKSGCVGCNPAAWTDSEKLVRGACPAGAGGENGIGHHQDWLGFPCVSVVLRPHDLHPHPCPRPRTQQRRGAGETLADPPCAAVLLVLRRVVAAGGVGGHPAVLRGGALRRHLRGRHVPPLRHQHPGRNSELTEIYCRNSELTEIYLLV
eukprot:COSAG01_NODE_2384_length_7788_cov_8.398751_13_plen_189_part_00